MGVFEDLGVMVDGLEDETAEEFGGDVEEIFRFDVLLTPEQDIEIGVNIAELEVEGFPEFGEEYSMLAHTFAELITEHVGMYTEGLMMAVADLPELDVELTEAERAALANEDKNENGSVLLYSFPVLIMEDEDDGSKNLGAGFNRSPKADVMLKIYGEEFVEAENSYQDMVTDAVLDHGVLFLKAVEAIQKL
ncbi:MAG: hypothetical protein K6B42_04520 [Clostridia bacterium]|nr:hypothetical protein [Clostridia bacterium]